MMLRPPNSDFSAPRPGAGIPARSRPRHARRGVRSKPAVGAVERLESRALLAVSAAVTAGELAIRCNAANDVVTLTAYDKHFTVTGTGLDTASFWNAAVTRISVGDTGGSLAGQTLIVGGSVPVTRPLAVSNIEKTLLGTSVVSTAKTGDVSFGGPLLLPSGKAVTIRNTLGAISFGGAVDGSARLTIDAPNQFVSFKGKVGGVTPLTGLSFMRARGVNALGTVAIDGKGSATADGIVFGAGVQAVKMAATGSSVKACRLGIVIEASTTPPAGVSRELAGFNVSGNQTGIRFSYPDGVAYSASKAGFYRWNIQDSVISGNSLHGIHLTADVAGAGDVRETRVRKNVISGNAADGIRVETAADDMSIAENFLVNNGRSQGDAAIRLEGGVSSYSTPVNAVSLYHNTISMTIPANGRPTPATGILVRNMPQFSAGANIIRDVTVGISLSGGFTKPFVLLNNVIERPRSAGIVLDSTKKASTSGNQVFDGTGVGLVAIGGCPGTVVGASSPDVFRNNAGGGIVLQGARYVTLQKVFAEQSKASGIVAVGSCQEAVIDGATVRDNTTGIVLQDAAGLKIRNTTVSNNSGNGLVAGGDCPSTVMWSRFDNNKQNGIVLAGARNLSFVGPGGVSSANDNGVHGLVASGNCQGTQVNGWQFVTNASSGIVLDNAPGLAVFGSTARANKTNGLLALGSCVGSTVAASTFADNLLGVVVSGAQGLAITSGNTVKTNKSDGLYVTGDCAGTTFNMNTVSANANAGLGLYAARQVTVMGNTVTGNKVFGLVANGLSTGSTAMNNIISGSPTNVSVTATGGAFQKI